MQPSCSPATGGLLPPAGHASLCSALEATPTVAALLSQCARAYGDHPALSVLTDPVAVTEQAISFAELDQQARRVALALRQMGHRPDDVVCLLLPNVPAAHAVLWGTMAACIAFPMNLLLSQEALVAQLNAVGATTLIVYGPDQALGLWEKAQGLQQKVPGLRRVLSLEAAPGPGAGLSDEIRLEHHLARAADAGQLPDTDSRRPALMIHTGGSSGKPKVAMLSNRNVVAAALGFAAVSDVRRGDRQLVALPLFHAGGAVDAGLMPLACGATLVLPTAAGMRHPAVAANIWRILERARITLLGAVPTTLAGMLGVPTDGADLSRFRLTITGGAPQPAEVTKRFEAVSGAPVHMLYGMTECAGIATVTDRHRQRKIGACGRPIAGIELRINTGAPGTSGEVELRGPGLFLGYHGDSGRDAQDWLATGDLGYLDDDGDLWITGRKKDLIIRSGHNIDPRVIEDIAATFPAVQLAAAVGAPDAYAGELPHLFVVAAPGAGIDAQALREFLRTRIEEGPAMPRHITVLPQMPMTPLGKVFKPALRALSAEMVVRDLLARQFAQAGLAVQASVGASGEILVTVALAERASAPSEAAARPSSEAVRQLLGSLPVRTEVP